MTFFKFNFIKNYKQRPTNKIAVEITKFNNKKYPEFSSIYPGTITPNFPNEIQSKKDKEKSEKFWNRHAFIE